MTPSMIRDADVNAEALLPTTAGERLESMLAGQSNVSGANTNVRQHEASAKEIKALSLAENMVATPSTSATFNPPSHGEALSIFGLVAVLVVMMMGVVIQKKRNEHRCRERYERANRAAQIRRVSIRMSQDDYCDDQEYEEEKDSLL